ncbi:hypothetical protein TcasGA2_TC012651 [Tribolium castaneum]|uniref:Uncharacterized protein n=1 Tax=Tribolium castaneum TaxID=7070 RepID=D6WZD6_TRICA|nr:hypothetical protein TcasGA2_TC012651 [Tribolium castaneum]
MAAIAQLANLNPVLTRLAHTGHAHSRPTITTIWPPVEFVPVSYQVGWFASQLFADIGSSVRLQPVFKHEEEL